MTDEATLRALINQAVSNGFDHPLYLSIIDRMMNDGDHPPIAVLGILLMHREFTRAAWGDANMVRYGEDRYPYVADQLIPAFKYHAQQVVASDDPFGYVRGTLV